MQTDDVIWHLINQGFCSFKSKVEKTHFCRNPYNVTGLCNRTSCPLANSQYATVIEKDGVCYLYMKTIERAHTPAKLWEVIKLSENYKQALAQIDQHLQYWPDKLIHRNKQRLTKIWQYLIRMRRLRNKVRPTIITINQKIERREKTRERKALSAALVDQEIKKELIERLKQGTYGGIYNFAQESFDQVLNEEGIEDEALFVPAGEEEEYVEDDDEMYADLEHGPGDWDSVDGDDDEDAGDDEEDAGRGEQETGGDDDSDDLDASRPKRPTKKRPLDKPKPSTSQKKRAKKPHISLEYEEEHEHARPQTQSH